MEPTSPGWYNDPQGVHTHQAYWDGENWTQATRPGSTAGGGPQRTPLDYPIWARTVDQFPTTWENVAVELGIEVVTRSLVGRKPKVLAGKVSGCDVTVGYEMGGEGSPSKTGFAVQPPTDLPFEKASRRLTHKVWSRSFQSDDPDWDKRFVVKTKDHDATRLFFTADRRAIFDQMTDNLALTFDNNAFVVEMAKRLTGSEVGQVVRTLVWYVNGLASGRLAEAPDV